MSGTRAVGWALFVLFLVLLVLKATVAPEWSWWWITAPLWAFPAAGVLFVLLVGLIFGAAAWDGRRQR